MRRRQMCKKQEGMIRTHHCGELRGSDVDKQVILCGWVNKYRNLGHLHFVDIRDKYGMTQLGFEEHPEMVNDLKQLSLETVIMINGVVRKRPEDAINKTMLTGEIEVQVQKLKILSLSDKEHLPFLPCGTVQATEDLKLKYRYLDLRTKKLQDILALRSKAMLQAREVLVEEGFVEVETPILYKSTPEGARDYIVPSRIHPKAVYALPQSPQTLKQLLMIGGTDKYFQLARCFRDEDLRADRQPEFTQIDIEASFITQNYIKNLCSKLIRRLFNMPENFLFPTIDYATSMELYGTDKPDIRFDLKHMPVSQIFIDSEFTLFSSVAASKGLIKAIFLPITIGTLARKEIDALTDLVRPHGGKGVAWFKVNDGKRSGGISKFISDDIYAQLDEFSEIKGDGTWFFVADKDHQIVHASTDVIRRHLAKKFELLKDEYRFVWISDFPLLEWSENEKRFMAKHHPFTMPKEEFFDDFMSDQPEKWATCLADAYDLVCNGNEIAGGSIRIYRQDLQAQMFRILGMTEEEVKNQFGFFIEALKYGTPPHGGIACGFDRWIMLLAKTENIRDVIAFPKTTSATDLMSGAPTVPHEKQTSELHFQWRT